MGGSNSDKELLDRLMNAQRCPKRLRSALNEYASVYADRPILAAVLYCDRLMSDISQDVVNAFFSKDTFGLKRMSSDMSYLASQLRALSSAMNADNLSNNQAQAESPEQSTEKKAETAPDASDEASNADANDSNKIANIESTDAIAHVDNDTGRNETSAESETASDDDGEDIGTSDGVNNDTTP